MLEVVVHDLRDGASDARRTVDDAPYGGGAGMVLAPGPIFALIESVDPPRPLLLLSAAGERFDHHRAVALARLGQRVLCGGQSGQLGVPGDGGSGAVGGEGARRTGFSLLCGRYEGVDERVAEHLVDAELSIGDYVLAGGELGALVVIEAVARLLPGVLGNKESVVEESFAAGLVEHPQYTRPSELRGHRVPEVLLSGDHGRVDAWRRAASLWRTVSRRPDLLDQRGGLSPTEARLLLEHGYPLGAAGAGSARPSSSRSGETPPKEPDQP